jgi:hypothetical protein
MLSGLFIFPLIIASFIAVGLMVFMAYHWAFARTG